MKRGSQWQKRISVAVLLSGLSIAGLSQEKAVSDAQVEANVLKALAGAPELADQAIGSSTVYGTVTLSGSVSTEALRSKAEQVVSNTPGVKKVVDELVIGTPDTTQTGVSQPPDDIYGNQSQQGPDPADANSAPIPNPADQQAPQDQMPAQTSSAEQAPPSQPGYPQGSYPQSRPAYPRPYRVPQQEGQSVIIPAGTVLRVRINQAMDSRHTAPGTPFDGVMLNDVVIGGMVAIPRGAMVQGQVSDAQPGGDLRGRGGLALQLTQVTLEGRPYPLATEPWLQQGYDKTGQTVGTTVGLGAVGATIGAIAGGGPGAVIGAGIGAIAGLGASSASHQGEATVPAEAIMSFRLTQQAALMTVSQAELDRLGAGLPPQSAGPQTMRRRYYAPPPPPPYYYGPYYRYPYAYPYYR